MVGGVVEKLSRSRMVWAVRRKKRYPYVLPVWASWETLVATAGFASIG